ncbi:hypothetical protein TNCV_2113521 [Trichonephila clavipes]|nr:hypothetical protein TNCV_2113521 [Trichonephila clavipes]
MSDMETEPPDGALRPNDRIPIDYKGMSPLQLCDALESYNRNQQRERKTAQGNDKRRKQKEPKKKAAEPLPEETDNDKCRHHKENQKLIKMTNGRLSFLEHCIKREKEFPDLADDDALIGYQKEHDELSSLKEHKLGELALILPCFVLDCPENTTNSIKQNENHFGFKDAFSELRRFFLDYPFLLEMGRQFSENNGESSSPVTDRTPPSRHLPSQRLVESLPAHWPGNPRPLVEQVTPIDPRSHGDPDYLAIQYSLFLL